MSSSIRYLPKPRKCEYCTLLRSHRHRHGPISANHSVCGACDLPSDTTSTPRVCPACIVYTLLHKNTFFQWWNDIQTTAPPATPLQAHRSLHHPTPAPSAMSTHPRRPLAYTTPLTRHVFHSLIDLTFTIITINAIEVVLPADIPTHTTVHVHIAHPTMSLTLGHLHHLNACLHLSNKTFIPFRIIYHHLLISAKSPLVSRDRSILLTIDNDIHSLTPIHPITKHRRHFLHLFLNPYNRSPYRLYTFDGGQHNLNSAAAQHLTISTSLPSSIIPSKRPTRNHMMRTTSHTPDLGTVLTFPADSVQHHMTILILATYMILSIP